MQPEVACRPDCPHLTRLRSDILPLQRSGYVTHAKPILSESLVFWTMFVFRNSGGLVGSDPCTIVLENLLRLWQHRCADHGRALNTPAVIYEGQDYGKLAKAS